MGRMRGVFPDLDRATFTSARGREIECVSVRHIAAFGNAVLEIIPLRLRIGPSSAARPLIRVGLDRQRATLLRKLRANRDCLVWMRFRPRFSQQSGSRKRQCDERSALTIVFMVACQTSVFSGRNEPARQMNRNPPKTASQLEDPPANQNGGLTPLRRRLRSLLLDGCSVYCL